VLVWGCLVVVRSGSMAVRGWLGDGPGWLGSILRVAQLWFGSGLEMAL